MSRLEWKLTKNEPILYLSGFIKVKSNVGELKYLFQHVIMEFIWRPTACFYVTRAYNLRMVMYRGLDTRVRTCIYLTQIITFWYWFVNEVLQSYMWLYQTKTKWCILPRVFPIILGYEPENSHPDSKIPTEPVLQIVRTKIWRTPERFSLNLFIKMSHRTFDEQNVRRVRGTINCY